jgi:hypothetical protein
MILVPRYRYIAGLSSIGRMVLDVFHVVRGTSLKEGLLRL